jgi:ribosomal protein S28E/S33
MCGGTPRSTSPNKGTSTFYYERNRSAVGSFLKENAGTEGHLAEISVGVVDDPATVIRRRVLGPHNARVVVIRNRRTPAQAGDFATLATSATAAEG